MTIVSPAVLLVASLACAMSPEVSPADLPKCGPKPTQEEAEARVQVYVKNALKDPFSAVVRNVSVLGPSQTYRGLVNGGGYMFGWTIAFEVNAKNSYGGYTGFQFKTIIATPDGLTHWGE